MASGAFMPSVALAKTKKNSTRKRTYPIIYRLNGGTNRKNQKKTVDRNSSIKISKIKKPWRKGYTFVGWYTDRKLKKRARKVVGQKSKAKRTLYAKWKAITYRISYELNGGKFENKQPTRYKVNSKKIVLGIPVRKGYRFAGWYTNRSYKKRVHSIKTGSTGNKKLYAKWELETYSIGYELNGGMAILGMPANYTVKSSKFIPTALARSGFRFEGWYADAALTQKQPYIKSGSAGDVTLYAKWVPTTYWDSHIDQKCAAVNKLAEEGGDAVTSLVFITDMHIPSNALVSPELARRVVARTNASMVVFGGDAINAETNKDDALAMLRFVRSGLDGTELHFVRGNHDANTEGKSATKRYEISSAEFLELTSGVRELREYGSLDYCRDDKTRKVRFIFLDTGAPNSARISLDQLDWLKKRILELDEEWTVLGFAHQFFSTNVNFDSNGMRIKRVLNSVYDSAKAQIAGVISGHIHCDRVEFSYKGYPMIAVTNDAHLQPGAGDQFPRKLGTTTEQAFDVVTLDTRKKMIYLTRIGAGVDRAFQYAEPEPEPVAEPEPSVEPEPAPEPAPAATDDAPLQAASM